MKLQSCCAAGKPGALPVKPGGEVPEPKEEAISTSDLRAHIIAGRAVVDLCKNCGSFRPATTDLLAQDRSDGAAKRTGGSLRRKNEPQPTPNDWSPQGCVCALLLRSIHKASRQNLLVNIANASQPCPFEWECSISPYINWSVQQQCANFSC